jgi:hypothetical protein
MKRPVIDPPNLFWTVTVALFTNKSGHMIASILNQRQIEGLPIATDQRN